MFSSSASRSRASSVVSRTMAGTASRPGGAGGPEPALAHDELVAGPAPRGVRLLPDDDRLEQAELLDAVGQLLQRLVVEGQPRLLGVRDDVADRELQQPGAGHAECAVRDDRPRGRRGRRRRRIGDQGHRRRRARERRTPSRARAPAAGPSAGAAACRRGRGGGPVGMRAASPRPRPPRLFMTAPRDGSCSRALLRPGRICGRGGRLAEDQGGDRGNGREAAGARCGALERREDRAPLRELTGRLDVAGRAARARVVGQHRLAVARGPRRPGRCGG